MDNNYKSLYLLAQDSMKSENWTNAAKFWDRIIELFPEDKNAYNQSHIAHFRIKDFKIARLKLEKVKDIFPEDPETWIWLANFFMKRKKWNKAIAHWNIVRNKFPNKKDGFIECSLALIEQKKYHLAEKLLLVAKKKFPVHAARINDILNTIRKNRQGGMANDAYICFAGFSLKRMDKNGNIVNRPTTHSPDDSINKMYVFGNSRIHGLNFVSDEYTIPSIIQKKLNKDAVRIKVINHSIPSQPIENIFAAVAELDLNPGDWIIIQHSETLMEKFNMFSPDYYKAIQEFCQKQNVHCKIYFPPLLPSIFSPSSVEQKKIDKKSKQIPGNILGTEHNRKAVQHKINICSASGVSIINLIDLFDRPHNMGEVFADAGHMYARGNIEIADAIYKYAIKPELEGKRQYAYDDLLKRAVSTLGKRYLKKRKDTSNQIDMYINSLPKIHDKYDYTIGSIVMNCNPFTLGHLHLIKTTAAQVDYLYIFIVQEDLSTFPFEDRLRLVREATKELGEKVIVVPGGKFIISSITFKEYFTKDKITKQIDPSNDVMHFALFIAPALNITHRFVGEEPNCNVTRQYNETMQRMLPRLGIDVHVIPRKEENGVVISASTVRRYLEEGNFERISRIVPPCTYNYLKEKTIEQ